MKFVAFVLSSILFLPGALAGQEEPCVERVLLPVIARNPVPGAHGSLWQTTLTLTNHGDADALIGGIFNCRVPLCPNEELSAGASAIPRVYDSYLELECERLEAIEISLRIRDLSRELDTWGTAVPVVYESDLFRGTVFGINDIPNDERFRSMLRIYGIEPDTGGQVHVRIFEVVANHEAGDVASDVLLAEFDVSLRPQPRNPRAFPDIAEIVLWSMPELANSALIRVEMEGPEDVGLWAMVSATNNETQHVTILAPRAPRE